MAGYELKGYEKLAQLLVESGSRLLQDLVVQFIVLHIYNIKYKMTIKKPFRNIP